MKKHCFWLSLVAPIAAFAQDGGLMAYSGSILEGGSPPSGARNVSVAIFAAPSQGSPLCSPSYGTAPASSQGRFTVSIDASCENVVRQSGELWVEVSVGGEATPRTKVRSVPAAVTAQRSLRTVATLGAEQISSNGLFVRATTATYTGAWSFMGLTGYRAGKKICETLVGATAHVCSTEEANRSYLLGATLPPGWLMNMSGVGAAAWQSVASSNNPVNECVHHTADGPANAGSPGTIMALAWDTVAGGGRPVDGVYPQWCVGTLPILCCD